MQENRKNRLLNKLKLKIETAFIYKDTKRYYHQIIEMSNYVDKNW